MFDESTAILLIGGISLLVAFIVNKGRHLMFIEKMRYVRSKSKASLEVVDVFEPVCMLRPGYSVSIEELVKYHNVRGFLVMTQKVSWKSLLRNLEARIMNYRVILESNPDNKMAEVKLKILEDLYKRIVSHGDAYKVRVLLLVEGTPKDSELLISYLRRHGCMARRLAFTSITSLIESGFVAGDYADPSSLAELVERGTLHMRNIDLEGVYIGRDLESGSPVYVSLWEKGSRHVLVLGPTGRGKTSLLASMVARIYALDYSSVLAIDPKGDLTAYLTRLGLDSRVIRVDKNMVNDALIVATRRGIPLSTLLGAGVDLSANEASVLDSLAWCHSSGVYQQSVKLKLSLIGIDVDKLCYLAASEHETRLITELEKLLATRSVLVLDLSSLNDPLRNIMLALLLNVIISQVELMGPATSLRVVLVIDEAWRLSSLPLTLLSRLLREGRSYGISVIMATQDPEEVGDVVWNNVSIVFAFGSHDKSYIEALSRVLSLDENDKAKLRWMRRGEALVRYQWDPRPLHVVIDLAQPHEDLKPGKREPRQGVNPWVSGY